MARADLIIDLVKHSMAGNKAMAKKVTEAIIAEEREKQHSVLADKLQYELNTASKDAAQPSAYSLTQKPTPDMRAENLFIEIIPERKLDSLILPVEIVKNCREFIEEQFRADLLRSYGLEPRNKILLIGAPGNGKTSLAEAIAESMMVPLYVVKYDAIIGAYLGETAMRLRRLIDFVSTRRCVLFFDEFETIGKERGDTHETGEIKRVVSSLLLQLDQLPSYVTVIGATNHPELLDKATWRRFQIRMTLPLPTRANIAQWVDKFQKTHNVSFGYSSETIAKRLLGACYAEIEEFGLAVLRRYVLSMPKEDLRSIVSEELKNWEVITEKIENTRTSE